MPRRIILSVYIRHLARICVAAAIVFIPIRYRFTLVSRPLPPIYSDYRDVLLFISEIFVILALLLWGLSYLLQPRRFHYQPVFLSLPLVGLTVAGLVSVIFSVDPWLSANHTLRLVLLVSLFLFLVNEKYSLGNLALPLTLQVLVQAVVATTQFLRQSSLGLGFLGELELDPNWSGISIVWAEGTRLLRAYGLADHPNILGGSLAFALVFLVASYSSSAHKDRLPIAAVFIAGCLGLLLTFSRSAWLALAAGLTWIAGTFAVQKHRQALLAGVYLAFATAILLLPFAWSYAGYLGVRLNRAGSFQENIAENRSIDERGILNIYGNQVFAQNALIGIGLGAFPVALAQIEPDFPYHFQPPHFTLLEAAAETGIFGALFYLMALVTPWLAMFLNRRRLSFTAGLVAASGALLAITLVGFFDYYPWLLTPGRNWQWLIWGIWAGFYLQSLERPQHV